MLNSLYQIRTESFSEFHIINEFGFFYYFDQVGFLDNIMRRHIIPLCVLLSNIKNLSENGFFVVLEPAVSAYLSIFVLRSACIILALDLQILQ